MTDAEPVADAPAAGAQPIADAEPAAGASSAVDAEPAAGVEAVADAEPAAGVEPVAAAESVLEPLIRERKTEHGVWTRIGLLLASGVFFALGVVGWLVPVITGVPFYVLGFITLGMASRRVAHFVNRQEARLPHKYRVFLRRIGHRAKPVAEERGGDS